MIQGCGMRLELILENKEMLKQQINEGFLTGTARPATQRNIPSGY